MKLIALSTLVLLQLSSLAVATHPRGWHIKAASKEEARQLTLQARGESSEKAINVGVASAKEQLWWADYKQYFKKHYASNAAEAAAFKRWKATLEKVHAVNLDPKRSWWASPSRFADMHEEEISKILMSPQEVAKIMKHKPARGLLAPNVTATHRRSLKGVPDFVDWRKAGKVMPAKSQGDCGGCWAYAGTTAIESAYLIHAGKKTGDVSNPFLSVNQVLNCANSGAGYYSNGCGGGNPTDAFNFANKNGVATDSYYNSAGCGAATVRSSGGAAMVAANSEYALKQAVARLPTVAFFAAGSDFMNYVGGVYDASGCNSGVNHALTVYGYDQGNGHWKVMNSWGSDWWGESGTAKIRMTGDGQGPCMMYTFATYPSLSFKN